MHFWKSAHSRQSKDTFKIFLRGRIVWHKNRGKHWGGDHDDVTTMTSSKYHRIKCKIYLKISKDAYNHTLNLSLLPLSLTLLSLYSPSSLSLSLSLVLTWKNNHRRCCFRSPKLATSHSYVDISPTNAPFRSSRWRREVAKKARRKIVCHPPFSVLSLEIDHLNPFFPPIPNEF